MNFSPPPIDFTPLANLGKTYANARAETNKSNMLAARQQMLSELGAGDPKALALGLLKTGDLEGGMAAMRMSEAAEQRAFQREEAARDNARQDRMLNRPQIIGSAETGFHAWTPGQPLPETLTRARGSSTDYNAQVGQREAQAKRLGLQPHDPRFETYILTGKMPREDAQPLTATDKKAILDADEGVEAAQAALTSLARAKELSGNAYDGALASQRGWVMSQFGNEGGNATTLLNNEVTSNALSQMKAIFGGNPTEGERKILLEIQGSANQPQAVRDQIYARAEKAVQRRLAFNKQRADAMRGGSFYKSGGGAAAPGPATNPLGVGSANQPRVFQHPSGATIERLND
jgi:hypothetical protein